MGFPFQYQPLLLVASAAVNTNTPPVIYFLVQKTSNKHLTRESTQLHQETIQVANRRLLESWMVICVFKGMWIKSWWQEVVRLFFISCLLNPSSTCIQTATLLSYKAVYIRTISTINAVSTLTDDFSKMCGAWVALNSESIPTCWIVDVSLSTSYPLLIIYCC